MPESFVSWIDGDLRIDVVEKPDSLQMFTTEAGEKHLLIEYGRGDVRSIIDQHSLSACTLRVSTNDGDTRAFTCPADVCVVLLVKLRKFQGISAADEVSLPESSAL